MLAWTGLRQLILIPLVPKLMQRFDARYIAFTGLAVFTFDVCLPFARRLSPLSQGWSHPAQKPVLDHVAMEKRGHGVFRHRIGTPLEICP